MKLCLTMQLNRVDAGPEWTVQAEEMAQTKAERLEGAGFSRRAPGRLGVLPTALPAGSLESPVAPMMPNAVDMP